MVDGLQKKQQQNKKKEWTNGTAQNTLTAIAKIIRLHGAFAWFGLRWLPSSDLLHSSAYQIMFWMASIHRYLQSHSIRKTGIFFTQLCLIQTSFLLVGVHLDI